jgi:pyruvate dehydrogenase E1 component alpha subunit
MASIWKLPVVFVCENNLYAISGCVDDTLNITDISRRGESYGIPGVSIDGNDIFEVFSTVKIARQRAVASQGPTLIEAKTYRWLGHWHADPCRYREEAEVEKWKKKCPIKRLRDHLAAEGILGEKQIRDIEKAVHEEIEMTEKFALESPMPDPDEALSDVYAE